MADVFEYRAELHPWREKLWDLIECTTSLDWLLLTKRPSEWRITIGGEIVGLRMYELEQLSKTRKQRMKGFLTCSTILRPSKFLSCEPLVGPIDVSRYLSAGLEWVIAGGESGGKSRPSHPGWFRNLRDQCIDADVPFLFKQWGNWSPLNEGVASPRTQVHMFADGEAVCRHNKKEAGRLLDGRTWDDVPVIVHDGSISTVRTTPAQQEIQSRLRGLKRPIWTENKAKMIAIYLRLFVYITKHGAYIDGFAGPQERDLPMWTAKLVLESEPKRLGQFYCADQPNQFARSKQWLPIIAMGGAKSQPPWISTLRFSRYWRRATSKKRPLRFAC